ncbi:hypothetical protein Aperf_G00000070379 [Anoplocephala perfoliata]
MKRVSEDEKAKQLNGLLLYACELNEFMLIRDLIRSGASPNAYDVENGKSALIIAAEVGSAEALEVLIQSKAAIDKLDKEDNMAIHWAAARGHLKCLQLLIAAKSLIDVTNVFDCTPLMLAIDNNRIEIVRYLLEFDRTLIRGLNKFNKSELTLACKQADLSIAYLLLQYLDPNISRTKEIQIAFQEGITARRIDVLYFLSRMGADINYSDDELDPPIFEVVKTGDVELIDLFITSHVDLEKRNKIGWAPLTLARALGYNDIVKILAVKPGT